ncbi:polysaccharide deacetylase family protein [candidate division CSSED10-310 bacterium]|uniref:Polysaccharide deacetylase family protein n=1 Tax=candidate division CSSED10-310 bacterium TaxID=2855610 RepID=A0ABV6Z6T7_UNCC1
MPEIILAIDVEEWYQTLTFEKYRGEAGIMTWPGRADSGIQWILQALEETRNSATFFVNGELAEHFPGLVHQIAAQGHEIACHGYCHQNIHHVERQKFGADVAKATAILQTLIENKPLGFRAPNWSLMPDMDWVFEALTAQGFVYDASILPFKTPWFGISMPGTLKPRRHETGLITIYPSIVPYGPFKVPLGLGLLLRLYPYPVTKFLISTLLRQGSPVQLNSHAWELAESPPPWATGYFSRFLTKAALGSIRQKMKKLLTEYNVIGIQRWLVKNERFIL